MTKKKSPITKEFNESAQPADDTSLYHGVYAPLWRPQIDCGTGSLDDIQQAIQSQAESLDAPQPVSLEWQQDEQGDWYAVGNDGSGETTLHIARLERVPEPANQWGQ